MRYAIVNQPNKFHQPNRYTFMAYDEKFRKKAVEYKDSGHSFEQLKEVFGISHTSYYKWKKNKEISGFYSIPRKDKYTRKGKVDPDELRKIAQSEPDLFLYEIAEKFDVFAQAIHKRLKEMKITFKKRHSHTQKNPKKQDGSFSQS